MKRTASTLWAVALALLFTGVYWTSVGRAIGEQMRNWPVEHAERDFPWYYLAAGRLLRGEEIYSGLQEAARQELGIEDYFIDVAVSPPPFPLVIAPLALLPYPVAWLLWQGLSLVALGVSLWLILRELRLDLSPAATVILICGVLLFPPLTFHLFYAHTELFLLLLLTGAWISLRRGREVPAGVLLGLAAAVRLYPLIFLPYLWQRRARKALLAAVLTGLGLALLAGVVTGPEAYLRYLQVLRSEIPVFYPRSGNLSLWGSVYKVASFWPALGQRPIVRDLLAWGFFLAVVGGTFWLTRAAHRSDRLDRDYNLLIAAALLASPLSWIYYQVLLYLPFLLLGKELRRTESRRTLLLLVVLGLVAALFPLLLAGAGGSSRWMERAAAFLPTLTTLAIYPALAILPALRQGEPAGG